MKAGAKMCKTIRRRPSRRQWTFFREPEKKAFTISPDGMPRRLAGPVEQPHEPACGIHFVHGNGYRFYIQRRGGDRWVGESIRRITNILNHDVKNCYWIGNDDIAFLTDVGGDGNFHLYLVPRAGGVVRDLTAFSGVRVEVIDAELYRPDEILIAMNQRDPDAVRRIPPDDQHRSGPQDRGKSRQHRPMDGGP